MTLFLLHCGNSSLIILLFRFHPYENINWLAHRVFFSHSGVTTCKWFFEWGAMKNLNCCAIFSWLLQLENYLNNLDQLVWIHLSISLLALQVPQLSFRILDSRQHMQQSCSHFEWVGTGRNWCINEKHIAQKIFRE